MRNEITRLQAYAKFNENDWKDYESMEKMVERMLKDKTNNVETKFYFDDETNAVEVVYINDGVIIATLILKKEIGRPKISKNPIAKSVMITLDEDDWRTIDDLKVQMGIKSNSEFWRCLFDNYVSQIRN